MWQVRRLGDFHPVLSQRRDPDGQDIDDPLYGNPGGEEEKVRSAGDKWAVQRM